MEKGGPVLLKVRSHSTGHVVGVEGSSRGRQLVGELGGEGQVGVVQESSQPVLGEEREVRVHQSHGRRWGVCGLLGWLGTLLPNLLRYLDVQLYQ